MSTSFTWTENAVIQELEREKSIVIDRNSVGSQLMPWTEENADTILWEVRDNVKGLMLLRGAEEPYPNVKDSGVTRYVMQPARLGESHRISEQYIERARQVGDFATPINIDAEAARIMDEIAFRENSWVEYTRWTLLSTGSVLGTRADGSTETVATWQNPQTYTAPIPWTTVATAVPIGNFRTIRDTYAGYGYDFGYRARAFASSKTWANLLANTNTNDFAGRRGAGLTPINGISMFNTILSEAENIPMLVAVDDGYIDASGTFNRYIPDGKVVVVGYHNNGRGLQLGNYVSTRNGSQMGRPGTYAEIYLAKEAPMTPVVARGHNGGPRINYSRQTVVFTAHA